jgi:D-alanyl-D-alanine dipeptidase
MGTEVNADPGDHGGACRTDAPDLPPAVRANRQALSAALRAVDFVNYPTEWWHWSCGDRYWAFRTGRPAARYGPVTSPVTSLDG